MPPQQGEGEGGGSEAVRERPEPQPQQQNDDLLPTPPAASSFMRSSNAPPPTGSDNAATAPPHVAFDHKQQQQQQQQVRPPAPPAPALGTKPPHLAFLPSPPYSSFTLNVIAGGGAGVVETILTYPLDLVRTRFQMMRYVDITNSSSRSSSSSTITTTTTAFPRPPRSSPTVVGMLVQITREEGFWRLYRGLLPPLLSEVPRRALKFSANDFFKQRLASSSPSLNKNGEYVGGWGGIELWWCAYLEASNISQEIICCIVILDTESMCLPPSLPPPPVCLLFPSCPFHSKHLVSPDSIFLP